MRLGMVLLALGLVGCNGSEAPDDTSSDSGDTDVDSDTASVTTGLDPANFFDSSLNADIVEEACTLANGEASVCYRVVAAGEPTNHDLTSVCPRTITDSTTGFWLVDGEGVNVDGPFIEGLADTFSDPAWQMYDAQTGEVNVTDTAEDCLAAGGMPLDPNYGNYCVECSLDDVGGAMPIQFLIPSRPTLADAPTEIEANNLAPGISLNGVRFDFPAGIAQIEAGYQIAPIDFCGGHTNFNIGYHYHEDHGCIEGVAQSDGHAALIGYAIDGFGINQMLNEDGQEPADLDECRGHTDDVRGYHYHSLGAGENALIGCLSGVLVEGAADGGPGGGPGGGGGGPGGGG